MDFFHTAGTRHPVRLPYEGQIREKRLEVPLPKLMYLFHLQYQDIAADGLGSRGKDPELGKTGKNDTLFSLSSSYWRLHRGQRQWLQKTNEGVDQRVGL